MEMSIWYLEYASCWEEIGNKQRQQQQQQQRLVVLCLLPPPPRTLSSICKKVRLKSGTYRMQLTLRATRPTPDGSSRLVQAMCGWSVKTGRAHPRHCRDAGVCGHTTSYSPPRSLFCQSKPFRDPGYSDINSDDLSLV